MKIKYLLAASVVSLSAAATFTAPVQAQTITSTVEGTVTDDAGMPLVGATATITDTRTNREVVAVTDANGSFRTGALQPGGPYTVTITAPGYEGQTTQNVFTNVGQDTSFTFALTATAAGSEDSVIVVTGARARVSQVAVGPGTAFGTETLESFPSLTRDIRDIIRIDPRVSLEGNNDVDRISCLGGNDRTNTFTVDGIVQADAFGLNGTPFAARNSLPLPFDAIEQVSVEFAPFDVEYSEFTGCLVNAVTKAGNNRFSGSAFITYFDDNLFADNIDGLNLNASEEKRWGATLSGPIIKDRLFFSFGYEEVDLAQGNNFGPAGGGFTNEALFATQAQFDEFAQIARDVYGQDIGGYPTTLAEGNVRYFGRLDAVINDDHRLEATYQRLEETNIEADFGGQEIGGFNSFEDEGTISDYYSVRLYSDWSDSISTELRVSRAEVGDVQGPVGFGEAQAANPTPRLVVGVANETLGLIPGGINGRFATGPGIFRSANQLDTKIDQARFLLNYDAGGGHFFKIGAEVNDLEVFNLFAINATGTLFFQNFDDFRNGLLAVGDGSPSVFSDSDDLVNGDNGGATIAVAQGADINNAAARFSRQIYSVFAQDEWEATDQLTFNMGLRVQLYDGDAPQANPNFLDRYGFTNRVSFAQIDPVILPRFSANYSFDNEGFFSNSSLLVGVGAFSGGDPVVYYSNAFSNNGFSSANGDTNDCALSDLNIDPATGQISVLQGGQFTGIPACAVAAGQASAEAGLADVQSTDPDLDVPTVVRGNVSFSSVIGPETGFFSNWNLNLDYIYSKFIDPLNFVDLSQAPDVRTGVNGFTTDGRPILAAVDATQAGCNAVLQNNGGTPPVYSDLSAACFGTRRDDNIQLTNGRSSESHVISLGLNKRFSSGLFTEGGAVQVNLGYAWTDSQNARNNQSSTATSSFDATAAFDRQDPAVSRATTETRHNITAAVNFREEFFEGYDTSLGIFFRARSGRPFSLTFDGGGVFADSASGSDNALLYIPTGISDPNVSPLSDPEAVQEVLNYVGGTTCDFDPGETIERNSCKNDWHFDMDLRIAQELPFLGSATGLVQDRVEIFADFANVLNMLDSSWNILRSRGGFNGLVDVIDGELDDQGRYVFRSSGFRPDDQNQIAINASAWRIQIGARYEF